MALTDTQQAQYWQVLKDSPLVKRWPDFRTQLLPRLEPRSYAPGDFIFHRGDPPAYLYIVVAGRVVMQLQEAGETWFEQAFLPGEFFGQQMLFDDSYRAAARASLHTGQVCVLLMHASDLQFALERAPALREDLLHEDRAARLRRVPLFRTLEDSQLRWLAQLVEERSLAAGETLDLPQYPGVWIVDMGQMALKGAIHPAPRDWDAWRITAGHLFVSPGDPALSSQPGGVMRFGMNCAADSAAAHAPSRLFYLPAQHVERLISTFPDVGSLLQRPVDVTAALNHSDLFKDLLPKQKAHLAQFVAWEFVPERQNITTQGSPGNDYVMVREGGALITALDNYGRQRPRSRLEPYEAFGKSSLLEGKVHDATVRAVRGAGVRGRSVLAGADILRLYRHDLEYAMADNPDLWSGTHFARRLRVTQEKAGPEFDWMQEGEDLKWDGRPHILWLLWPLALVILPFVVLVALLFIRSGALNRAEGTTLLLIGGLVFLPLAIGLAINYYDDYYAVTSRRVTRRDRRLLLFESRTEAPVEMIQDVTVNTTFWGRIFDYGDVSIRTASKSEPIRLNNAPHPDLIKVEIESARIKAQAQERAWQKEELRRGLIKDLGLALAVPQRQQALGDVQPPMHSVVPVWLRRLFVRPRRRERLPTPPNPRIWLARRTTILPDKWRAALFGPTLPSSPQSETTGMTWRKHWLNALRRAGPPFLAILILLVIAGLALTGFFGVQTLSTTGLLFGWLVLMAGAVIWFWWEYTDYRNDIYVVTDDRIIDIEMKPLGLSMKRREGGLSKVQNVVAQQNGLWANIFDYGDVVISTAAADEGFTFIMVPNPKGVQTTVFQKLEQFRSREEHRRASGRQQEMIEALSVYHQVRGGGPQADGFTGLK